MNTKIISQHEDEFLKNNENVILKKISLQFFDKSIELAFNECQKKFNMK